MKFSNKLFPSTQPLSIGIIVLYNLLLVFIAYTLCRVEFLLENLRFFSNAVEDGRVLDLFFAGIRFDTPGIFYTNALYILMMLFPFHYKERSGYYKVCKWIFIIINSLAIIANLADSVYFPFTLRRTTWDVASEFSNEENLFKIFFTEIIRHWYVTLLAILMIWGLIKCYISPSPNSSKSSSPSLIKYYIITSLTLIFFTLITIGGIRGGWFRNWYLYIFAFIIAYTGLLLKSRKSVSLILYSIAIILTCIAPAGGIVHRDIRPIALSNAASYTRHPNEIALVLNTPFSIIRTINSRIFVDPGYFPNKTELNKIYSPEHFPAADTISGKNVVIIIIESFGREYIGSLNHEMLGDTYQGFTPFTDSLVNRSAVWRQSFCNGRKSIDGMPSILAGIPMFVRPFILTPAAFNKIEGLPDILRRQGYHSAFFHGARTGSMGFDGFSRSVGFSEYFGREDFDKNQDFNGERDFDGYWAIWDEPFMQYYALEMSKMPQPFITAIFTASSHHPFNIPDKFKGKFPEGQLPIHKCIGYTDYALRRFFETASKQPWYRNTLFVITSDHTNQSNHEEYKSDIGGFRAPIIFFDPSGGITPGMREGTAQQTDIMPTVLGYLHSPQPFVAFGNDLFSTPDNQRWAVNQINGIYQFVSNNLVLQFDGDKSVGLYHLTDYTMKNNLLNTKKKEVAEMEKQLKAIIQQYMDRMISDRLTIPSH